MRKIFAFMAPLIMLAGAPWSVLALEEPPEVYFVVKQFNVTGDNPLSESETQSVLQKFTGDHYGLEGLQSAADALEQELRARGFAFYRVTLIPQELKEGIIQFEISEFSIDKITIDGNEHFSTPNIQSNTPGLESGKTPNTAVLSRAINMANELPSKSVKLTFAASETGDAIDAKINVEDSSPQFFFLNFNNTGTEDTGEYRLTGAYTHSNLFDADHSFTATYTLSPDEIDVVSQIGLFYSIPFFESGSKLSFFLADSDVETGTVGGLEISGSGTVLGVSWNKRFLQTSSFKHEIEAGITHKAFESNSGAVTSPKVVSRPLMLAYRGSDLTTSYNLLFNIEMHSNLSGGSNNEEADYDSYNCPISEPTCDGLSTADWSLFRYGLTYQFFNSGWIYRFVLNGQQTSDRLISGEQFGAGGSKSVRGFEERQILGDTGHQLSLEAWMPAIEDTQLRPLFFYDMASVTRLAETSQVPAIEATDDLASLGAGVRWSWNNQLNLSTDLGYVIKEAGTVEKGDIRLHLDLFYRF